MSRFPYFAFGETLDSERPLPELPARRGESRQAPALSVRFSPASAPDLAGYETVVEWPAEDGRPYARLARDDESFWLAFPGHAGFLMAPPGRIDCFPEPGCDERLLRHFLLNQAVPRFLGHLGRLVLHAGAVVLRDGSAVVLCGPSGRGKSTLAAAFLQDGHTLLADDCVRLEVADDQVRVFAGVAGLRLRREDVGGPFSDGLDFGPLDVYSGKHQALVRTEPSRHHEAGAPLRALLLLDPPFGEVGVQSVAGAEALVTLQASVYGLEHREERATVHSFRGIGAVLDAGVAVFRLQYPRRYEILPDVVHAVCTAVEPMDGGHQPTSAQIA